MSYCVVRGREHSLRGGECQCFERMYMPDIPTDFGCYFQSSHRDGGYMPSLRPGQVKVHDGDVTSRIYDLSGLGRGAGREFEQWWRGFYMEFGEPTFTYAG